MTKEEKISIYDSALRRAYRKLSEMEGDELASEAAVHLLRAISMLRYELLASPVVVRTCECECSCHKNDGPEQSYETPGSDETDGDTETAAPAPEVEPTPEPVDTETAEATETESPEHTLTLVDVRTILSDLSGRHPYLDLESILLNFGAKKLSLVDPADYAALVQAAKEAAGEA